MPRPLADPVLRRWAAGVGGLALAAAVVGALGGFEPRQARPITEASFGDTVTLARATVRVDGVDHVTVGSGPPTFRVRFTLTNTTDEPLSPGGYTFRLRLEDRTVLPLTDSVPLFPEDGGQGFDPDVATRGTFTISTDVPAAGPDEVLVFVGDEKPVAGTAVALGAWTFKDMAARLVVPVTEVRT